MRAKKQPPTKRTRVKRPLVTAGVIYAVFLTFVYIVLSRNRTFALFDTAGTIAQQEKGLIVFTVLLGCTVVIPVLVLTFAVAWHYREGNAHRAAYRPEWGGSRVAEAIWWVIPAVIIAILGVVIWRSSRALDPFRQISSDKPALNVQVVALDWRWLFIYPEQHVATLSYLEIPTGTPVNFTITSDAPMNSFWIPQLGGQIYAMSGMSTKLSVEADTAGNYEGRSANLSGAGFSGMEFTTTAVSLDDFSTWSAAARKSPQMLDKAVYDAQISPQSQDTARHTFMLMDQNLYNKVIDKYTQPMGTTEQDMSGMKMGKM